MTVDHREPRAARPRPDLAFLRRRVRAEGVRPGAAIALNSQIVPQPALPSSPAAPVVLPLELPRISAGQRTQLCAPAPMVALTRVQSGVGCLLVTGGRALSLGCAYSLEDGYAGALTAGRTGGPNRPPVRIDGRTGALVIDLRRCGSLVRLVAFASDSGPTGRRNEQPITVTTAAGACLEIAWDHTAPSGVKVFLSLYNVSGEFVVRAESRHFVGDFHDVCRAYDFHITA